MTNKEFIKKIDTGLRIYYYNADEIIDHAKKLVAVVEAASTVAKKLGLELDEDGNGAFYSTNCKYDVAALKTALKDLERE